MKGRYRFGAAELDAGQRELRVGGRHVRLGGRAFDLLLTLVRNADRVVTKDELYEAVWPGVAVQPNNLQVHVWTLRRLLGASAIATVARRGYRLMLTVEHDGPGRRSALDRITATLLDKLRAHRVLTLTGGDAAQRRARAHAVAQSFATARGPWLLEGADAAPDSPAGRRVLEELAAHGGLAVLHDADSPGSAAASWVAQALAVRPDARVLLTARSPLGLPHERACCLERRAAPRDAGGSGLRWHERRVAAADPGS